MASLSQWVIRWRWPIIACFVALTAAVGSRIPTAELDPSVKSMLPEQMASRIAFDQIEELFGGTDMIMLVVSADDVLEAPVLRRVRKLSRSIERIKNVDRVMSLFTLKEIRADAGDMIVESAVLRIPETGEQREALRGRLRDNDLVYGNVVAKQFDATVIIALLNGNADDEATVARIKQLADETPGPGVTQIAGMPYVRSQLATYIGGDMRRLLPFGILIMLAFLFWAFRQLRGVLLPFIVVVMAIVFSMGLIPLLGWKVTMLTVIMPVVMIAVANDYGIHLYARYQEENVSSDPRDAKALAASILQHLGKPVIMTGVTTMVGLLSLLTHIIVPAKQMGVLAAAGVGYALVGSLLFIPAVLSLLPRAKPIRHATDEVGALPPLERLLRWNARMVSNHPWPVVVASTVTTLVVAVGILWVAVDANPVKFFPESTPIRQGADLVNAKFGGSTNLGVVAEGDIKDPALLAKVGALQAHLDSLPAVGQTGSIVDVVERMHRAMHDGAVGDAELPASRDAVAQYFLMYSMSGEPEDLDRLVDFPFKHALLNARINTLTTQQVTAVLDAVEAHLEANPGHPFTIAGGFASIFAELVDAIVRGQLLSLLVSLLLVSILVALLFRSAAAGLLTVGPLCVAMVLLFGLMGIFGIELNHITAMLSSIMIGVGVDYTIHFLWRYREERRAGRDHAEAIRVTLVTSGRGIVFNALSVMIGFTALMVSSFLPVQFFGFLVVVTIGACLTGALVLLPAAVLLLKPRFLEGAGRMQPAQTEKE